MASVMDSIGKTLGSAAKSLVLGGAPTANKIDSAGDQDWFRVDGLAPLTTYTIEMKNPTVTSSPGTNKLDPKIQLMKVNADNKTVSTITSDDNSGGNGNAKIVFTTDAVGGSYVISAMGAGSTKGDYSLSINNTSDAYGTTVNALSATIPTAGGILDTGLNASFRTTDASSIAAPQMNDTVGKKGDVDGYMITLEKGKTYQFDAGTGAAPGLKTLDTQLGLYRVPLTTATNTDLAVPANLVRYNDDRNASTRDSQITWTADSDGLYYLKVSAVNSTSGAYSLSARVTNTSTADVEAAPDANGKLSRSLFVFNGANVGSKRSSIGTAADVDSYSVQLQKDHAYRFVVEALQDENGAAFKPVVTLYNKTNGAVWQEQITETVSAGAVGPKYSFMVDTNADSDGYYISVANANAAGTTTGDYELQMVDLGLRTNNRASDVIGNAPATASTRLVASSYPITQAGVINYAVSTADRDMDYYDVKLVGGKRYTFTAMADASTLDPRLVLTGLTDATIATNNDISASDKSSRIVFLAPENGVYSIGVGGAALTTGAYSLNVKEENAPAEALVNANDARGTTKDVLTIGATRAATLDVTKTNGAGVAAIDFDWYKVAVEQGKTYQFTTNKDVSMQTSVVYQDGTVDASAASLSVRTIAAAIPAAAVQPDMTAYNQQKAAYDALIADNPLAANPASDDYVAPPVAPAAVANNPAVALYVCVYANATPAANAAASGDYTLAVTTTA